MRLKIILLVFLFAAACAPSPEQQATLTTTSITATAASWTQTPTPTLTFTPTETLTPTITFTPTITPTFTVTATATFAFPTVTVNKQAHCRYGPSVAYLHAADLYPGDKGSVRGRFVYSKWLYVKFDKLDYFCWVAPSVVDVVGDVSALKYTELNLQSIGSNQYSTSYTVKDEAGCAEPSSGKLYTVEKHGFSDPVDISWPPPP